MGEWSYSSIALDLGIRRRWVVSFTPRPLYSRVNNPSIHWIGGWVTPETVLTLWSGEKSPSPAGTRTPDVQPVATHTELSRFISMFIQRIRHPFLLICARWLSRLLSEQGAQNACWTFFWHFTSLHLTGSCVTKCTTKSIRRRCVYLKWNETDAGHPCLVPRSRQDFQSSFKQRRQLRQLRKGQ
jgi:hypothetical protein